jgi:PGF-pre-PGF domain-containing protein
MDWNGDTNFNFVVNGLPFGQAFCGQGQTLCDDGICRPAGTCTLRGCINNVPNQVCEIGEGCGCQDCINERDSCEQGLVCLSSTAGCGILPAVPTGAVFGARAPFECTWSSTYDDTALPGSPIDLIYYHDCTLLREVSIEVSGPVTGTRIKTFGNESMFTKPTAPSSGYVFGYFKFDHNIPPERFSKITMQFKVSKEQLAASGLSVEGISLQRFADGSWVKLPTKFTAEDNEYYYFESVSQTLSLFAVVGEKVPAAAPPAPPTPAPTPLPVVTPAFPIIPIALAVLLILTIITLGYRWYVRRPAAITMPAIRAPPTTLPEAAQLQQRIAEIKRALELPASKLAPEVQRVAKIGKEVVKPKAKPTKRTKKLVKKTGEKKFYRALGKVEKALR